MSFDGSITSGTDASPNGGRPGELHVDAKEDLLELQRIKRINAELAGKNGASLAGFDDLKEEREELQALRSLREQVTTMDANLAKNHASPGGTVGDLYAELKQEYKEYQRTAYVRNEMQTLNTSIETVQQYTGNSESSEALLGPLKLAYNQDQAERRDLVQMNILRQEIELWPKDDLHKSPMSESLRNQIIVADQEQLQALRQAEATRMAQAARPQTGAPPEKGP